MTKKLSEYEKNSRKMRRQALTMIKHLIQDKSNPIDFHIESEQVGYDFYGRPVYSGTHILKLKFTKVRRMRKTVSRKCET